MGRGDWCWRLLLIMPLLQRYTLREVMGAPGWAGLRGVMENWAETPK
jgi:hypothetical protein